MCATSREIGFWLYGDYKGRSAKKAENSGYEFGDGMRKVIDMNNNFLRLDNKSQTDLQGAASFHELQV
jgi:hypothetical protein